MIKLIRILVVTVLFGALQVVPAAGQSLIRDAEIENTIRTYATPIFSAAGLDPDSVSIHLIADDQLNAFVAGGQRLFIFTGLLIAAKEPGEVIGVIAHETGHIAGGHLARMQEELRNAQIKSIVAMVLGAVAGVATRSGGAAGAIMSAGQAEATGGLLHYSRTQESSADAAGMKFLDQTGQSSRGMYDFLNYLQDQMFRSGVNVSPYLSTHPLTQDRINAVANHIALSKYSDVPPDPKLVTMQNMMRAKLIGFTRSLQATLQEYPESDRSAPARYARAIAYYRQPDLTKALGLINGLIAEQPKNPYFHELKGQMLIESGKVAESLPPYEKAVEYAPGQPLIEMELAKAQLETNDPSLVEVARNHLETAVQGEATLAGAWRLLTVAYSRLNMPGETALAQAEYSMLLGERKQAQVLAQRAMDIMPQGSPGWLRAQDIVTQVKPEKS